MTFDAHKDKQTEDASREDARHAIGPEKVDANVTHWLPRTTPVSELPEFLSPKEFINYTGLSRSTVYDLITAR